MTGNPTKHHALTVLGITYDEMLLKSIEITWTARRVAIEARDESLVETSHPDPRVRSFRAKSYQAIADRHEAELAALCVYRDQRVECREKIKAIYAEVFGQPMPDDYPIPQGILP
jgi:hypothetical protein